MFLRSLMVTKKKTLIIALSAAKWLEMHAFCILTSSKARDTIIERTEVTRQIGPLQKKGGDPYHHECRRTSHTSIKLILNSSSCPKLFALWQIFPETLYMTCTLHLRALWCLISTKMYVIWKLIYSYESSSHFKLAASHCNMKIFVCKAPIQRAYVLLTKQSDLMAELTVS